MLITLLSQAAEKTDPNPWLAFLFNFGPVLVLVVLVLLFLRPALKKGNLNRMRYVEHMNKLEANTDEMVKLLKDIRDRLDKSGT